MGAYLGALGVIACGDSAHQYENLGEIAQETVSCDPITPILECVAEISTGSYEARFGYKNPNRTSQTISTGSQNKFSPDPKNRGQPTKFLTGLQAGVFKVKFNGSNLTWTLTNKSVTASRYSTRCAPVCDPSTVTDGNPCTADSCANGVPKFTPKPSGTSCADNNLCNGAETCNGTGGCIAGAAPPTNDANPCTADSCSPTAGVIHSPVPAGTACPDGNLCNGAESCNSQGECIAGTAPTIDDGNRCTSDSCNPSTGPSHAPLAAGSICADGDVCNGAETCNGSGQCQYGVQLPVNDGNPCTRDACDSVAGVTHVAEPEGTGCPDGNLCNGAELCRSGTCTAAAPPAIDDANPCTADSCSPTGGVQHVVLPAGAPCGDGNACNGVELCDAAGFCLHGAAPPLDDANACTADSCDPALGVHHEPVAVGTPCDNGNACDGSEHCDVAGLCAPGSAPLLDDHNPCTSDHCDPLQGVSHTAVSDGIACSDGNACNGLEACVAGACRPGAAVSIDDGNPCTVDSCDAANGVTHAPLTGTSCADGDLCNGNEICGAGVCQPGTPLAIDDANPCTVDSCSAALGAMHQPLPANSSCSNGNVCDGSETCDAGGICRPGTSPAVDDGNPCTTDSCDGLLGVLHHPVQPGTPCEDDGDVCNGVEVCDAMALCVPTGIPNIDDGNPCTSDSCDSDAGPQHVPTTVPDDGNPCTIERCSPQGGYTVEIAPFGAPCGDTDACNGVEYCDDGACVAAAVPGLDDGDPCTVDSCSGDGQVSHARAPVDTPCARAEFCGNTGLCDADGQCRGAVQGDLLNDGDPCTTDICDPSTGVVSHEPSPSGTKCDDLDPCTSGDNCDPYGGCTPQVWLLGVDDGNVCTIDTCTAEGLVSVPGKPGTPCGQRAFCDGSGKCASLESPDCNSVCEIKFWSGYATNERIKCIEQCVIDVSGVCATEGQAYLDCFQRYTNPDLSPEVVDFYYCAPYVSELDLCRKRCGGFPGGEGSFRDDAAAPLSRDCVTLTCGVNALQKDFKPAGTPCVPIDECVGPAACNGQGRCDPVGPVDSTPRACAGAGPSGPGYCDGDECISDGTTYNPCTVRVPYPDYSYAKWVPLPDGVPCRISECSTSGTCQRGRCLAVPLPAGTSCDDSNVCNGVSSCDGQWVCRPTSPIDPSDDNRCTDDLCDPDTGTVSHILRAAGASCEDATRCNGAQESCTAGGECVAAIPPPNVDDGNPCTQDLCDFQGVVQHIKRSNNSSCADSNVCNGDELCQNGVCVAGQVLRVPDDGNPCTADACHPTLGVRHDPLPAGSACPDSTRCNGDETCNASGQCSAGIPPVVDDNDVCTNDACDPVAGVTHVQRSLDDGNPCTVEIGCDPAQGVIRSFAALGATCADANACNGSETCDGAGVCRAGIAPTLDDGNPCTFDVCLSAGGVQHQPAPGGTPCADANVCNGSEICSGLGTCLSGVPVSIDDGLSCTTDSCDPATGVVHAWSTTPECGGSRPTWQAVAISQPPARDSAAVAYATDSSEVVVFGGESAGVALGDTWLFDTELSQWRQLRAPGPPPRAAAAAALDASGRVLVFGGVDGPSETARYYADLWELDVLTEVWTQRSLTGQVPSARGYASLACSKAVDKCWLFGGAAQQDFGDTWELDTAAGAWRALTGTGPAPRSNAGFELDPATDQLLLYGGTRHDTAAPQAFADTWSLNPQTATWQLLNETSPPGASAGHSLVFDPMRQVFAALGGTRDTPGNNGALWGFDPNSGSWGLLGDGPARSGLSAVFDEHHDRILAGFGVDYSDSGLFTASHSDWWGLPSSPDAEWVKLSPRVAPYSTYATLAYDASTQQLVTFGTAKATGSDDVAPVVGAQLIWRYDAGTGWRPGEVVAGGVRTHATRLNRTSSAYFDPRRGHVITASWALPSPPHVDESGNVVLSLGGDASRRGLYLDEQVGDELRPVCKDTSAVGEPAMAFDSARGRLLVFGGPGDFMERELRIVDTATCAASSFKSNKYPWPWGRVGAAAAWDSRRSRFVLMGGYSVDVYGRHEYGDSWVWTEAGQTWTQVKGGQPPFPAPYTLQSMVAVYDPVADAVILVRENGETWKLDMTQLTWSRLIAAGGGPSAVTALTFDGSGVVTALDARADLWSYAAGSWQRKITGASPSPRSGARAVGFASGEALLFGGLSGDGRRTFLQDTWVWNDGWRLASYPTANQSPSAARFGEGRTPSARTGHALVVVPGGTVNNTDIALLFGGESETGVLGDTWFWDALEKTWFPAVDSRLTVPQDAYDKRLTETALVPALDHYRGVVLFGGRDSKGVATAAYRMFSGANGAGRSGSWTSLSSSSLPAARWAHAIAADPNTLKAILFGGRDQSQVFADTWQLDLRTRQWARLTPANSPPGMFGHQLTYDAVRRRIVLTGGASSATDSTRGDTWEWHAEANAWRLRDPELELMPRAGHAAFFDQRAGKLMAFGGLVFHDQGTSTVARGDTLAFERADVLGDLPGARYPLGAPCASDAECGSGACSDGVCCNSRCDGQCSACNLPGRAGSCGPVKGTPQGSRPACSSSDECAQCGGESLLECGVKDTTICGTNGCQDGFYRQTGRCMSGQCTDSSSLSCAPYACMGFCRSSCLSNADCFSSEYECKFSSCVAIQPPAPGEEP